MNSRTLIGMAAASVIGLSGTALGCYVNSFSDGSIGAAEIFGDAQAVSNKLQLTPDVAAASGAIIFDAFLGQTIRQFDASFDYLLNPGGTLAGAHLIFALGDLPEGTIAGADTVSGLAVDIRAANIGGGFGNFVYVSVWMDGVAIVPEGTSGFVLPSAGWASDVPVAVSLDETGALNVSINGTPLVSDFATGYSPTQGHRMGITALGGNGADQTIDNVDIHANPATITNMNTATPYTTIQSAVDAAATGDTIHLGEGIICEDNILFPAGLDLVIEGAGMDRTLVNGGNDDNDSVFNISAGQTALTVIRDMTITNTGLGDWPFVNGVEVNNSSPTISSLALRDIYRGAGVYLRNTDSVVDRCIFSGCDNSTAALWARDGSPVAFQCLFYDNTTSYDASRYPGEESLTLINCTLTSGNQAAISAWNSVMNVINCVIPTNFVAGPAGVTNVSNTLNPAALPGVGNLQGMPVFVDPANGDYRLAAGSPGVDAADSDAYIAAGGPVFDLNGDARMHDDPGMIDSGFGSIAYLDMGAYEFQGVTPQPCTGDVTGDQFVDVDDLNAILSAWNSSVEPGSALDLANADGFVDVDDLNVVLANWGLDCNTN
ncbi:MAG: hypothetical protein KDA30_14630 [Phycisphaerales bacterium]|nr:hypothetical protein [Phycisphaerales bacterium]